MDRLAFIEFVEANLDVMLERLTDASESKSNICLYSFEELAYESLIAEIYDSSKCVDTILEEKIKLYDKWSCYYKEDSCIWSYICESFKWLQDMYRENIESIEGE